MRTHSACVQKNHTVFNFIESIGTAQPINNEYNDRTQSVWVCAYGGRLQRQNSICVRVYLHTYVLYSYPRRVFCFAVCLMRVYSEYSHSRAPFIGTVVQLKGKTSSNNERQLLTSSLESHLIIIKVAYHPPHALW